MALDRDRRYETADGFANDITSFRLGHIDTLVGAAKTHRKLGEAKNFDAGLTALAEARVQAEGILATDDAQLDTLNAQALIGYQTAAIHADTGDLGAALEAYAACFVAYQTLLDAGGNFAAEIALTVVERGVQAASGTPNQESHLAKLVETANGLLDRIQEAVPELAADVGAVRKQFAEAIRQKGLTEE